MANSLLIEKETGGYFGFTLTINSVVQDKVRNMRNDAFAIDNVVHFKTATGANIVKQQNISVFDITLIASGTFTFTDIDTFFAKLVDVGYWEWLLGTGGGSGVDRFDELLDTFDYFGNDMKGVRVNESQLKLEPFTVYNYRKSTDLEDMPNTLIPNKMFVVNEDGTEVILKDQPSEPITYLNAVGSFNYSDEATQTVPIAITAGVETKITNDTLGEYTKIDNAPFGVSSMYNPIINAFDFSQLSIGDMVWFRTTFDIDLDGTNSSYKYVLKCAVGSGATEWELPIHNGERKSTDSFKESHEFSIVMDYQFTIDYPAELWITTDASASLKVDGFQIKVLRKNINIVLVANDDTKEDVANKVSTISGISETEYPNEKAVVDYVDSKLPADYATVVYVDTNDPNTATIFDDVNPPVTNDPLLEDDVDNLYIGADSSTWVYNGATYTTEIVPDTSNFFLNGVSVDAGNNKTGAIGRLGSITSQEAVSDTSNNSGSTLGQRGLSFFKWLSGVATFGRIKWDNIGANVTFQLPNTADNAVEILAIRSDLAAKQDVLTDANFGTFENSLTAKATPIDADLITIVDTADSNKAKKTTFTQLKAFLKTYWDTLYQVILISGTNIKTINGSSILGSGDLTVSGGGGGTWGSITGTLADQTDLQTALNGKQETLVSGTNIKTIDGVSVLGSGNITLGTAEIDYILMAGLRNTYNY